MSVGPSLEAPRPADGAGFSDAITFAFGDAGAGVYGLARVGLAGGAGSGLALLLDGRETVAARAEGGVAVADPDWEAVTAGGVSTTVEEPLRRWTVRFDGGDEGGYALECAAIGEPVEMPGGGLTGYEQLVRVRGAARLGGRQVGVDCLGQRGHSWGTPDWDRLALTRTLGAWLDDELAVVMSAQRPAGAHDHEHEELRAVVLEGEPPAAVAIAEPRLSTTYDGDGRQRRAGWELWPEDDEEDGRAFARRGAGEALCGTSVDLGRLRLDCAFFRFRMEGREGVGRYDLLRRV